MAPSSKRERIPSLPPLFQSIPTWKGGLLRKRTLDLAKKLVTELEIEAANVDVRPSEFIGVTDWARLWKVPVSTIHKYIHDGSLPDPVATINRGTRIYTRAQYEAWAAARSNSRTSGKSPQTP